MLLCTLSKMNENKNWVDILSIVELAINSMPKMSIGHSVFYLNYGYHPTVPSDLINGREMTQNEFLNEFCMGLSNQTTEICSRCTKKNYNEYHRMVGFIIREI